MYIKYLLLIVFFSELQFPDLHIFFIYLIYFMVKLLLFLEQ